MTALTVKSRNRESVNLANLEPMSLYPKKSERVFRIVDSGDKNEPFLLVDADGNQVRMDAKPQPLADYALSADLCDRVRHDYDLVKHEATRHRRRAKL